MDLARRAHQSSSPLVDEDGLRGTPASRTADRSGAERRGGLPCVGACSPLQLQEPLNRRRREDVLNSTHIFPVKSATACTEVTVTGKMSIGPPKDRCRRILWKLCRLRAKDRHFVGENAIIHVTQHLHYLHCTCIHCMHCTDEYIH